MTVQPQTPFIFHFIFGLREQNEPFHLMYYLCLVSCIEVNRPDAVYFHYQHEPFGPWWERIKPLLVLRKIEPEQLVADYQYQDNTITPFRYAHLADFARLQILLREGGIYADIDTLFLKPLPPSLRTAECVMGFEKSSSPIAGQLSLCNAWIAARAGSRFCQRWLEQMPAAFDGSWSHHSTLLPYRLSQQYPDDIQLLPKTAFFALDWTPRDINRLFLKQVTLPVDAYSLHLWNHLWFDKNRLDHSHFHAGMLTPEYVAFADTTYSQYARKFLPADLRYVKQDYRCQLRYARWQFPLQTAKLAVGWI